MMKSYKFPRDRTMRKLPRAPRKRWQIALEGTVCPVCSGTGEDCLRSYFAGHGHPVCMNGVLRFTEYDRLNWDILKKVYK